MKILFIAPLPPPITGQSIVSKVLLDELIKFHQADVANFSKSGFKSGVNSFKRIVEVIDLLKCIWHKKKDVDVIYLTTSESIAGNIKDILIYLICFKSLHKMAIHLHGGSLKKEIFDKNKLLFRINKYFIKKLGDVIISGKSHLPIFEDIIDIRKIHIVSNFASDNLFLTSAEITEKYSKIEPLRILYMSNLIPKKGYNELAEAFSLLDESYRKQIIIDFAGAFDSEQEKKIFLDKIGKFEQLKYHGIISEEAKRKLFKDSHVFCLPTSYFEGQPISILEAYASGCVVLTTGQSGILDIFQNNENGFQIKERTAGAVRTSLEEILQRKSELLKIALQNNDLAKEKYRQSIYVDAIKNILENNSK